eukprot:1986258-Pyramimonas_sp.AAC.1
MSGRTDNEHPQARATAPLKDGKIIARSHSAFPLLPARDVPGFHNGVADSAGRLADTDDMSVGSNDCLTLL